MINSKLEALENLTIKEARDRLNEAKEDFRALSELLNDVDDLEPIDCASATKPHPMLGKRCIVRADRAGVHIGYINYINPHNSMECQLIDGFRLWKWENGGLSLSAISTNGIKGGRLNRTKEVFLTSAIEYIPISQEAESTFTPFIEDNA